MYNSLIEALVPFYKKEILDRAHATIDTDDEAGDAAREAAIDPDDEENWYSLTLGWAIGKGLSVEEAKEFARQHRG